VTLAASAHGPLQRKSMSAGMSAVRVRADSLCSMRVLSLVTRQVTCPNYDSGATEGRTANPLTVPRRIRIS
jgi:hypothetical protein